jgi:histidinol-phosphate aminotransferase
MHLYPDPDQAALRAQMAQSFGLPAECLLAGNGSDELLAFIFQGFCPGGAAFPDITYGFYPVLAALYGVPAQTVPLRQDFELDIGDYRMLRQTLFFANPNAPTGLAVPAADFAALAAEMPDRLVVVDEAYADFGAESALPLVPRHDNLLVVGTFSKCRAMAGARLGWAAGHLELIAGLNRLRCGFNPYSLNRMTLAAGVAMLRETRWLEEATFKIKKTRARTIGRLRQLGFSSTNSTANFLFVSHGAVPAGTLYSQLRRYGVLVRWFQKPRIENWLRITVGTDKEMDILVAAMAEIIEGYHSGTLDNQ